MFLQQLLYFEQLEREVLPTLTNCYITCWTECNAYNFCVHSVLIYTDESKDEDKLCLAQNDYSLIM